jgi:hypothetical protein
MVPVMSLAIPIVLAAVIVFVASSIVHMVLPIHRNDLRKVAREDALMDAVRGFNLESGDYVVPHAGSPEGMKKPEFIERMKRGPVMFLTVAPSGPPSMGSNLALWFLYLLVVSFFSAYVTGRALGPGANYLEVFRFAGATAFMSYSLALPQNSIWWKRNWRMTILTMADGLLYGLLTGGTFGWLWPR